MMEFKGQVPTRMIKSHMRAFETMGGIRPHFTEGGQFMQQEPDPVTGADSLMVDDTAFFKGEEEGFGGVVSLLTRRVFILKSRFVTTFDVRSSVGFGGGKRRDSDRGKRDARLLRRYLPRPGRCWWPGLRPLVRLVPSACVTLLTSIFAKSTLVS